MTVPAARSREQLRVHDRPLQSGGEDHRVHFDLAPDGRFTCVIVWIDGESPLVGE